MSGKADGAIDVAFTEDRPKGTALAQREEWRPAEVPQPPALFGTDDPVEVIAHAVRTADALKGVVVAKNLISNIQGKQYPLVEAWMTLGAMLRVTAVCEWSRKTPEGDGWEARSVVRDRAGAVIGAAEAQCTRSERTWAKRDDYALRSMAQTRATSKALRSVLGFIMVLAGYEATPSEEMPDHGPPAGAQFQEREQPPRQQKPPPTTLTPMQSALASRLKELAWTGTAYKARCAAEIGAEKPLGALSDDECHKILGNLPTPEDAKECPCCGKPQHDHDPGCPEDPNPNGEVPM